MPVSIHSDEDCTPRVSAFHLAPKALQHSPTPNVLYSQTRSCAQYDPPPSLSDLVKVAPDFQPSPECNLVLRAIKTRSHTDFYVDRETIYTRSSYLKRKLSSLGSIPDGIDVISWDDDADTLGAMLRFIYPGRAKPVVQDVDHLRVLLKAARQYDIEAATHALGTAVLLDFAKREPIQAFAIACEFALVDIAALISKDTLEVDVMVSDKHNDLGRVSLVSLHNHTYVGPSLTVCYRAATTV
jgi:hypothetical protein